MFIAGFGTVLFGLLIGWISYRTLRLTARANVLSDIVITIAIVGGAAIIALLKSDVLFGLYSIGLIIGFFGYFAIGLTLYGKEELQLWQMPPAAAAPISPPGMTSTDIDELS